MNLKFLKILGKIFSSELAYSLRLGDRFQYERNDFESYPIMDDSLS